MSAENSPAPSSGYQLQADRFAERYGAYDSFWQQVETRWQTDDEENRLQLAPISRTVAYGNADGFDELTVSWKDGSAILISYLGTEDEMWDFADGNPRVRGFRFQPDTGTPVGPDSVS